MGQVPQIPLIQWKRFSVCFVLPMLLSNLRHQYIISYYIITLIITVRTQPAFTCSKLTIEALEQGVKYVQS